MLDHLLRGCEVKPEDEFRRKLELGRPLRVKYGIDPTGINVHLGHTVPLRKLRQFQMFGHKPIIIIGTYTALVGDPSGRDSTRSGLTKEQIDKNAQSYLTQVGKFIDLDYAEVHYNGEWFDKCSFVDVMRLTSTTTVQRILDRDDFSKRIKSQTPVYLHECLYPLMQGQDSVEVRADIELGGSEQLFNLMMGRNLQVAAGQEPQVCITLPILRGLDGVKRMGKSLNNYIGVAESPNEQFGKTMSIPDSLLQEWFMLLTDTSKGDNPFEDKKRLAFLIVKDCHGEQAALEASAEWTRRFSNGQDPTDIPEVIITQKEISCWKLVLLLGLASSGNNARTLISQGAVSVDRVKIDDPNKIVQVDTGLVVRVGSRKVVRIKIS